MKIAVVSEDGRTITGHTGRARRFLIYKVEGENRPTLLEQLEVSSDGLTFHALHDDDTTPHPIDNMVLITAAAGEGLTERLSRRGIAVYITSLSEPLIAVQKLLQGTLPTLPPTPHQENQSCEG